MEKRTRLMDVMVASAAGLLLAMAISTGLMLGGVIGSISTGSTEAAPPSGTTYWLVTGHPDAPVRHQLPSDPGINFELNWIVLEDGVTQIPYDQNCKVAYLNVLTGEWDRIEYYGNEFIEAAESMGGFVPPAMAVAE